VSLSPPPIADEDTDKIPGNVDFVETVVFFLSLALSFSFEELLLSVTESGEDLVTPDPEETSCVADLAGGL